MPQKVHVCVPSFLHTHELPLITNLIAPTAFILTCVIISSYILKHVLAAPNSPPQNVTGVVLSSTEIQVNWTDVPEIDQNGVITEYEVMYEPLMTFMGTESPGTNLTTILSILLQGLQEYVEYNISVRAYTNDGDGPYSVGVIRRTLQDGESFNPS